MLVDPLTKVMREAEMLLTAMTTGKVKLQFSCLSEGVLISPEKGLPPPKHAKAKDEETYAFLEAFQQADAALFNLVTRGVTLRGSEEWRAAN